MHVIVNSLDTAYERGGQKAALKVLILHGWADSSAGWQQVRARLEEQYEVVTPDLPGFGGSALPPHAWDLNDYSSFIGSFLAKIRFSPDVIIAHSNGGAIAIRGLARKDFKAGKLILLDSAGLRSEFRGRTKALRMITKTGKVFSYALPATVRKRLRHAVYKTAGSDMLVKEDMQETFKRIVTDDVQASAALLDLPTLLIYGADDEATPPQFGRILHSLIDGSELKIVPEAGHFVHLDKPDKVMKAILEYIR